MDLQGAPWCHPIGSAPQDPPVTTCKVPRTSDLIADPNTPPILIRTDQPVTNVSVSVSGPGVSDSSDTVVNPVLLGALAALIILAAVAATVVRRGRSGGAR